MENVLNKIVKFQAGSNNGEVAVEAYFVGGVVHGRHLECGTVIPPVNGQRAKLTVKPLSEVENFRRCHCAVGQLMFNGQILPYVNDSYFWGFLESFVRLRDGEPKAYDLAMVSGVLCEQVNPGILDHLKDSVKPFLRSTLLPYGKVGEFKKDVLAVYEKALKAADAELIEEAALWMERLNEDDEISSSMSFEDLEPVVRLEASITKNNHILVTASELELSGLTNHLVVDFFQLKKKNIKVHQLTLGSYRGLKDAANFYYDGAYKILDRGVKLSDEMMETVNGLCQHEGIYSDLNAVYQAALNV